MTTTTPKPGATMRISKDAPLAMMANIYRVSEPDRDQLVKALSTVSEKLARNPLFVSATVFSEPELMLDHPLTVNDGLLRVAYYVQRRRGTAGDGEAADIAQIAAQAGVPDDVLRQYTVAFTSQRPGGDGVNTFRIGDVVAIGESIIFEPEYQARARDHMIENDGFIRENAEALSWYSSNIHQSTDGQRNVNLIQFGSRDAAVRALTRAEFPPGQQEISRADAHAYSVADIVVATGS